MVLSPEWIPASSICSKIPQIQTFNPSEIASTSTSFASFKNLSIKTGLSLEALTASVRYFSNSDSEYTISIALPPKT